MRQVFVWLLLTTAGFAQGGLFNDIALSSTGRPAAGASVRVCTETATGTPCSPTATVYSDKTLSTVKSSVTADANGNFSFYAVPGFYKLQVTASGSTYTYLVSVASVWNGTVFADQFAGADMAAKINAAITSLPSTGGTVDARALESAQTGTATITLGTSSKPVHLLLGATALASSANPVIACPAGGSSSVEGISPTATVIQFTGSSADGVTWGCSRGSMSNLAIQGSAGTRHGLTLIATGSTSIQYNKFDHLRITGQTTAGNIGIKLVADSATALVSFNDFYDMEIVDFADSVNLATSGSAGPTNNHFLFGQYRKIAVAGNGIRISSGGDNTFYSNELSGHAKGIYLTTANSIDNVFFHPKTESNTLDLQIDSPAADNMFIGSAFTFASITDNGVRTRIEQSGYSKQLMTINTGGELDWNTEDSATAQVPVIRGRKSATEYFRLGRLLMTNTGLGATTNGMVTAAGENQNYILDTSSGSPTFCVTKKGVGGVFCVDGATGNTTVSGTLGVTGVSTFTGGAKIASGTTILKHLSSTASLDFAAWAGSDCQDLTVTVTGAADGDSTDIGVPTALAATAGVQFTGFVSSANTVTVRGCKLTAGASANPAAATVRADVWGH